MISLCVEEAEGQDLIIPSSLQRVGECQVKGRTIPSDDERDSQPGPRYSLLSSNSASVLPLYLSSVDVFMLTGIMNSLTACLLPFQRPAAHEFLLLLIPFYPDPLRKS